MTTTATTVKRQLLAARISQTRSLNNESALKWELHKFFLNLKDKVLKELHEYYPDDTGILLEGHLDLILAPIFESQQKYYNILRRFNHKEYNFGVREAKRLVKLAHNNNSGASKSQNNVKLESLFDAGFEKDDLFATQKWSEETLLNHSFTASETTMNRVDKDINSILTDGYKSGKGIPHVRDQINKRFNQLADWEAQRIARTEIHNAHQMGIINTYNELGIQYVQWSSTHDTRTRGNKPSDKANHVKLDGEIIPLGGTFSNGLEYPGDTKGPLREWMNCRCSLIPFIIPDGYIAPHGMAQFRESDLVQTLDYWNQDELLESIQGVNVNGELYGIELNPELMDSPFSVAVEDLSDFGIGDEGLEVIQGFTKRRFGADKEYGLAFNEKTGKILTKEFRGTADDVTISPPKKGGKYSTIHYHTDESLRPPSHGDFDSHLNNKKERVGINVSRNETWLMKSDRKFKSDEIEEITREIKKLESKQLTKMQNEYKNAKLKIHKIKDPKQRELAQKELDEYINNKFLDYHNKELGDNILEYSSKINGLKVKRIIHQEVDKNSIKSLQNLKIDKSNRGLSKFSKHISEPKVSPRVALRKEVMASEKDLFALTKDEKQFLNTLEQKQRNGESLKFSERHALTHFKEKEYYNEMRTQIIDRSAMTNENFDWDYFEELHAKFKDWTPLKTVNELKKIKVGISNPQKIFEKPDLLELSSKEKEILKNIHSNTRLIYGETIERKNVRVYKHLKRDLEAKEKLAELHKRAFDDNYGIMLSERESKEYVDLYLKYQEKWNLPNIDLKAYVSVPDKRIWDTFQIDNNFPISDRFKLTDSEDKLLKKLMKHKFLRGGDVSAKNEKAIQLLKDQRDFNDLYSLRLTKKGLSYKEDKLYRELAERLTENGYDVLATTKNPELSIFKELHVIHKSELKLKEGAKRYKTIKGLTHDGTIPQGLEIDDLFTYDVRKLSPFEKEIYDGWLNNHYRNYRAYFTTCKRNKECYNNILPTLRYNLSAEELEYNWNIIKNINKNQLKKNLRLFRRQNNHHLADNKPSGIPEIGDCVTFHGFNSTAITKEGADYYAKCASHFADDWEDNFKWLIEIEAPTGTQGAYVAPITIERYMPEMEYLLQEETHTIIKEFDEINHHARVQVVKECPKRR